MTISQILQRTPYPEPWAEGEKIPWNDLTFSTRMLKEHLSQAHDAASRRAAVIDRQVQWIHTQLLHAAPSKILDLGCGPGLYASRFAALGHTVTGIDFSPASIAYARKQAQGLAVDYTQADIRQADYGSGYDLVMLIYGEFNVFQPDDACSILHKAYAALKPGGRLLLEPHTYEAVREIGQQPNTWYSAASGLWSDQPHLVLHEHFWDTSQHVATQRYFIIDAESGSVTRHASSMQAYTDEQYHTLLTDCGFASVQFAAAFGPDTQRGLQVITAQKPE